MRITIVTKSDAMQTDNAVLTTRRTGTAIKGAQRQWLPPYEALVSTQVKVEQNTSDWPPSPPSTVGEGSEFL